MNLNIWHSVIQKPIKFAVGVFLYNFERQIQFYRTRSSLVQIHIHGPRNDFKSEGAKIVLYLVPPAGASMVGTGRNFGCLFL